MVQNTAVNQPRYRASVAAYNNQPAIDFSASTTNFLQMTSGILAQPFTYFIVSNVTVGTEVIIDTNSGAQANIYNDGTTYVFHAGATMTGGGQDANPHHIGAYYNGASSRIYRDGAQLATGNLGTNNPTGFNLGAVVGGTLNLQGRIAFAGVFAGQLDAHSSYPALKSWVNALYGIAMS